VVYFVFLSDFRIVITLWYILCFCQILELLSHCGIFCVSVRFQDCYDIVVYFVFVKFYNCYDIVVFFVFLSDFRIVSTLWYILCFCQILELLRHCGIFCVSFYSLKLTIQNRVKSLKSRYCVANR
jgi:hypothetical protein